jgi:hypothetical protein
MINEEYIIIDNIPKGKYDIKKISFDEELILELINTNNKIIIINFGVDVVYFKFMEEECDFQRVSRLCEDLGEVIRNNTVFLVRNSLLVNDIIKRSEGLYDEKILKNYIIISENHIIDIVTMNKLKYTILAQ